MSIAISFHLRSAASLLLFRSLLLLFGGFFSGDDPLAGTEQARSSAKGGVDFSGEQGGGGPVSGTPAAGEDAWPGQSRRLRPGSSAASPLRDEWHGELAVGSPQLPWR